MSDSARKTILVADDTEDIVDLVAFVLQASGCNVVTARDGMEAVEMAVRCRPNLIFMDLSMPILNGFEATRRILAMADLSSTVIVAVSANCDQTWHQRALDAGCVDCVKKPVVPDKLNQIVEHYVRGC